MEETTKVCRMCGKTLPISAFHKGYAKCRTCYSIYTGHKPKTQEQLPDGFKRCTKCKQVLPETEEFFYIDNRYEKPRSQCKECMNTASTVYQQENHEELLEYYRSYHQKTRERDRDKRRGQLQKTRRDNPERYRVLMHKRLARKRGLPDTLTAEQWNNALDYFEGKCAVCGRPQGLWHKIVPDHWIPLASDNCLGTVAENIVPLCHGIDGCNNSKSSKDAKEWLIQMFGIKAANRILATIDTYFESLND